MTKNKILLGTILLIFIIAVLSPAAALKVDKIPMPYSPSKEYHAYITAPAITHEQKEIVLKALEKTDVFKKYADISKRDFSFTWTYPYSGKIYVSTYIGSPGSDGYGLFWSDVDPKTELVLDYGISNGNKYW